MQLTPDTLHQLAEDLRTHRRMLGLSRDKAAAQARLSVSFIRDAETDPGQCTLERLLQLSQVLGVKLWAGEPPAAPASPGLQ